VSYLFDTQILIWVLSHPQRLTEQAAMLLQSGGAERRFSVVAIWETSIKSALRRPDFAVDSQAMRARLIEAGLIETPVTGHHAVGVRNLPLLHHDPFDRMLVAQAIAENLTLVTADKQLAAYPVRVMVV
jgi:PIN domain nuclease of toxin-antitoxin system